MLCKVSTLNYDDMEIMTAHIKHEFTKFNKATNTWHKCYFLFGLSDQPSWIFQDSLLFLGLSWISWCPRFVLHWTSSDHSLENVHLSQYESTLTFDWNDSFQSKLNVFAVIRGFKTATNVLGSLMLSRFTGRAYM